MKEGIKERLLGLLNPNKNAHSNIDTILALSELNNNTIPPDKGPESIGYWFEKGEESPMYKWGDRDYRPSGGWEEDYYEGESPSTGQVLKDALLNIVKGTTWGDRSHGLSNAYLRRVMRGNIETEWKGKPSEMMGGILNKMFEDAETGVLTDEQAKDIGSNLIQMLQHTKR